MRYTLVDTAGAYHVHIVADKACNVSLRQATANFNQELSPPFPPLLKTSCGYLNSFSGEVVKHDHISTSCYGFVGFCLTLALHFYFDSETSGSLCGFNGTGDATRSYNMVVFEHSHSAKVNAVRITTTSEHTILLDYTKARSGFACASQYIGVACVADESEHVGGLAGYTRAPGERIESYTLSEEYLSYRTPDRRTVCDWGEGMALTDMPFYTGMVYLASGTLRGA